MNCGYVNYYKFLTEEELIEEYKNYNTTKEVKSEIKDLMIDLKFAVDNSNGFNVSYGNDFKECCSLREYMENIGIRLDYLNKLYFKYLEEERKNEREVNEEYYKMLAFQSEFVNGFKFTEEELQFYRERFYDYYQFKGER